jgi:hypothetical protein
MLKLLGGLGTLRVGLAACLVRIFLRLCATLSIFFVSSWKNATVLRYEGHCSTPVVLNDLAHLGVEYTTRRSRCNTPQAQKRRDFASKPACGAFRLAPLLAWRGACTSSTVAWHSCQSIHSLPLWHFSIARNRKYKSHPGGAVSGQPCRRA